MQCCLEICVDNIGDFERAVDAGASRIELCAALEVEGLTPDEALLRHAARSSTPTVAMLRNRPGDFVLSIPDLEAILEQAKSLRDAGVDAIVLGALTDDAALDLRSLDRVGTELGDVELAFHRAFDEIRPADRFVALDELHARGFVRILSAGGRGTVSEGVEVLHRMQRHVDGRLTVLAGGGLRLADVAELRRLGIREFHASARPRDADGRLCGSVDVDLVRALSRATST